MPFSVRPFRRFPVCCPMTYHAGPFLKLPLAYSLGFASLITLLVSSSGPAYAEWVSIGANNHRGRTVYTDPDSIRLKGDLVKMWELSDFRTIQTVSGDSFLSRKAQKEFDCVEERARVLACAGFSGNMGSGNVIFSSNDEPE
jgi:hypothetical protein